MRDFRPGMLGVTLFLLLVIPFSQDAAVACPDGQSEGAFGWCYPNVGGSVGQGWEHLKREVPAQLAGNPLAVWIQQSRDTAAQGSQPIPPQIRQALTGYIPEAVLQRARFKVGDNGILNTAHVVQGLDRDVAAVTLDNIIVFESGQDAFNNVPLWAHELTHVEQYMSWGIRDFAISYVRDTGAVERPAYDRQNGYAAWWQRSATSVSQAPNRNPFQEQARPASVCATPYGQCPMAQAIAIGSPCMCPSYYGPIYGQAF